MKAKKTGLDENVNPRYHKFDLSVPEVKEPEIVPSSELASSVAPPTTAVEPTLDATAEDFTNLIPPVAVEVQFGPNKRTCYLRYLGANEVVKNASDNKDSEQDQQDFMFKLVQKSLVRPNGTQLIHDDDFKSFQDNLPLGVFHILARKVTEMNNLDWVSEGEASGEMPSTVSPTN